MKTIASISGTLLALAAAPAVFGGPGCLAPPSGLAGWWPADGSAADMVSTNNGILQGGASATATGEVGQAFSFDGTNSFVQIPDSPALRPASLTIEAWVQFRSLDSAGNAGAGQQYIVFKQNTRSSYFEGYFLGKQRRSGGDEFVFEVTSAAGQSAEVDSPPMIATGVWYHVAAMRGSNFVQLFVNGQSVAQTNVSFAQNYGTLPLYFGTSGQSFWDGKFSGLLDEVSLYNRALSSNEVAAIYAAGAAGKCKTLSGATITGQPQSQTVATGSNVLFRVTAGGTAPLGYKWEFNGAAISGATNATLTLANVQPSAAGNYVVIVTNSVGAATSTVAVLTVVPAGAVMIDGGLTYQVIDGFGVNANSLSWTNNELKPVLDAWIDQAGMTLFHAIIENSNWEATNDNSDANVMNWTYYNSLYSAPDFQKLWGMMAYLNQRGITNGLIPKVGGPVALWMGGLSLKPGYENEYAETVASLLVYARKTQHLQFTEARAVNEPDITFSGVNMTGSAQYVTTMHDVGQQLDANGMSDVRFSGPDLANTSTSWMTAMMGDSYLMSKVAHFGVHSYLNETSDATGVYDFIKQSPYASTHFWMTEYNVWCTSCQSGAGPDNTWDYARGMAGYLLTLLSEGASAGIVFEAYDSQYYGYDATTGQSKPVTWSYWGLVGVDNINAVPRTYTPRKGFYTLAQIAKFVRPGAQRINVGGASTPLTLLAFYNTNNAQVTVTGVNTTSSATSLSCALMSLPAIPSLNLYYTSSTTNLAYGGQTAVTNGAFSVVVPADCVFTLTYTNPVGIRPPPPVPPQFLMPNAQGGSIFVTLIGASGSVCRVDASSDLVNWSTVTNVTLPAGTAVLSEPMSAGPRFYRAMLLP